jgi:hypothetical protein
VNQLAKRESKEEVIVSYFQTADIAAVNVVFNIVKGIVKTRQGGKTVAAAAAPKATRKAKTASETPKDLLSDVAAA